MKEEKSIEKKKWSKPLITSIPFKDTRSGWLEDVVEDATYSVPS